MLDSIWAAIATPLGYLLNFCQYLTGDVLHLPSSYVFALLLFALIIKILFFPLALKQQRTMAAASAYKPMIDEIEKKHDGNRKKWARICKNSNQNLAINPQPDSFRFLYSFLLF